MERDRSLSRAESFYEPPIHFAVREGRAEAVRILLDAGAAEAEWSGCDLDGLIEIARDRSYEEIALLLDEVRSRRGPVAPAEDHPIHPRRLCSPALVQLTEKWVRGPNLVDTLPAPL